MSWKLIGGENDQIDIAVECGLVLGRVHQVFQSDRRMSRLVAFIEHIDTDSVHVIAVSI